MDNQQAQLTRVFQALGDPTRRAIVGVLGRGPASVTALAAPFDMALPSFMKHLGVLERSGLVRSTKLGRVRTCELSLAALTQAEAWLAEQRTLWETRADRLSAFAESLHQEETCHGKPRSRRRR